MPLRPTLLIHCADATRIFRRPAIYLARQTLTLIVLILGMLLVGLAVLVRGTG